MNQLELKWHKTGGKTYFEAEAIIALLEATPRLDLDLEKIVNWLKEIRDKK